ncbi:winged helix-turn-helix domain-containing protein [Pseudomonas sp. CGJS7]|uniref:winged helix-turn-helix domain-containing protein n=1 Tax=Pseudomonas sp. CGJS7 TaxID=3109348 RepID=UPI00300832C4
MTMPWPADTRYLQVADLIVDLRSRRTIHPEAETELPQRVFDLLLLFLAEPERVHTRSELFDRLWAGMIVEDANLSQSIWLLRKALGEPRKNWVRTRAKRGYAFEMPEPLQWHKQSPLAGQSLGETVANPVRADPASPPEPAGRFAPLSNQASPFEPAAAEQSHGELTVQAGDAPAATHEFIPNERTAAPRRRRKWWLAIAATAAVAAIAVVSAGLFGRHADGANRTVALVVVEDQNLSARWPAKLLEQWLAWKLGSLPGTVLLSESDLAAGNVPASARVVLLSSVPSSRDPAKLQLHARLREDGEERQLQVEGREADMPGLVDALSRQIVTALRPDVRGPWPALGANAEAARGYMQAAQALERRDWMTVTAQGQNVLARAPGFGLMHLQLAQAQSQLAQAKSAVAHMQQARELLANSPPPALELMRAQALSMDPSREGEALKAYEVLRRRDPGNAALRMEYARQLLNSGDIQGAIPLLADAVDGSDSIGRRIGKRLLLAEANAALAEPTGMRAAAEQALSLARGVGWTLEQAEALMWIGRADAALSPNRGASPAFERAAELFEKAGNTTGALQARVRAQIAAGTPANAEHRAMMDALLARASAGGYRRLEIGILNTRALQDRNSGDIAGSRSWLRQAGAVATAAGDLRSLACVELNLVYDDFLRGDLSATQARIETVKRLNQQGCAPIQAQQYESAVHTMRGDYAGSIQVLTRLEQRLAAVPSARADSDQRINVKCSLQEVLLSMGRSAEALDALNQCEQGKRDELQRIALIGRLQTERVNGDRAEAKALLARAEQRLVIAGSSTWVEAAGIASLATVLGELDRSERIYQQVLPQAEAAGYGLIAALALTGQAENAAAQGDWVRSRALVSRARALLAPDTWLIVRRLDFLAAADALGSGDHARARSLASALHSQARRHGDVVFELEIHGLFLAGTLSEDCSQAQRQALLARTGMRGVDAAWLNLAPRVQVAAETKAAH